MVCPLCGYHRPVGAYTRLWQILDPGSFRELDAGLGSTDPLHFPGYGAKLKELRKKTGMGDAAVSALGSIEGHRAVFVVLDSRFLMGSMGTAVGEKVTRATQQAGAADFP